MNKQQLKKLYKKFEHFIKPEIIREKINTYNFEKELKKNINIIKYYERQKLILQQEIEWLKNKINISEQINNIIKVSYFSTLNIYSNNCKKIRELEFDLKQLEIQYNWSKYWLKNYFSK